MNSAGLSIVLLLATGQGALNHDWAEVWGALQSAHLGEISNQELREALSDLPPGPRAQVAQHHQAALSGGRPPLVHCQELPELEEGGAWAFAQAIARGPALDRALLVALDETPVKLLDPLLQRGYSEFLAHSDAANSAASEQLAEALHQRARAVWSGQNLAIAKARAGDYTRAAEVLRELLGGELSPSDRSLLSSRLALVHLGEGGALRARRALGAGFSQGIGDSGIVLGLLSLERRRWNRARALFRSVLGRDPRQPWAARGWGLSMVPR